MDAAPYLTDAQKARIREWMGDGIVRVSVGLEDSQDLIADLDQALQARTIKGLVGPAAYAVLKRLQGDYMTGTRLTPRSARPTAPVGTRGPRG